MTRRDAPGRAGAEPTGRARGAAVLPLAFALALGGIGCALPAAGPTPAAGREPLRRPTFNGRDLAGWTVKCRPADRDKGFWRVEDGAIVADSMGKRGHDYVWLVTDEEYADFELRLRFQAYRRSPGNTGVQIRSRYDDDAGWLDGPQIDIHPPGPWRTGMMWDETRENKRWIFPEIPKGTWVDESMSVPARVFHYGDAPGADAPAWNDLEITAVGTKVRAVLNGVTVTDWDGRGVLDDEVHAKRRVGMKGHIALQIHSGDQLEVRFRDVTIRDLGGE